jgi:hypothetical protein
VPTPIPAFAPVDSPLEDPEGLLLEELEAVSLAMEDTPVVEAAEVIDEPAVAMAVALAPEPVDIMIAVVASAAAEATQKPATLLEEL